MSVELIWPHILQWTSNSVAAASALHPIVLGILGISLALALGSRSIVAFFTTVLLLGLATFTLRNSDDQATRMAVAATAGAAGVLVAWLGVSSRRSRSPRQLRDELSKVKDEVSALESQLQREKYWRQAAENVAGRSKIQQSGAPENFFSYAGTFSTAADRDKRRRFDRITR